MTVNQKAVTREPISIECAVVVDQEGVHGRNAESRCWLAAGGSQSVS